MDNETYIGLAIARALRSGELLEEAEDLLSQGKYKSANNRAYYSIEKAMQSLLALKQVTAETHSGCLKQFNINYIHIEENYFSKNDYKIIASAERIRTVSDYDDFYIADKNECRQVVTDTKIFYKKFISYVKNINGFSDYIEKLESYWVKDELK